MWTPLSPFLPIDIAAANNGYMRPAHHFSHVEDKIRSSIEGRHFEILHPMLSSRS
jgi:hypothetical protein